MIASIILISLIITIVFFHFIISAKHIPKSIRIFLIVFLSIVYVIAFLYPGIAFPELKTVEIRDKIIRNTSLLDYYILSTNKNISIPSIQKPMVPFFSVYVIKETYLRESPSNKSKMLIELPESTYVALREWNVYNKKWFKISFEQYTGWADGNCLRGTTTNDLVNIIREGIQILIAYILPEKSFLANVFNIIKEFIINIFVCYLVFRFKRNLIDYASFGVPFGIFLLNNVTIFNKPLSVIESFVVGLSIYTTVSGILSLFIFKKLSEYY